MSDISNELSEILTAERGEDVRMSIYRGLEKISNESTSTTALVNTLNEAITGQTGTNVRSFVEHIENAIAAIEDTVCYKDGDEVTFGNDCGNDFFMIPGLVSPGAAEDRYLLSFTAILPKGFKPSSNGYSIEISNLTIGSLYQLYQGEYVDTSNIEVLENGVLQNGILQCVAVNDLNTNKLHILMVVPTSPIILLGTGPIFLTLSKLDFAITENSAS